MLAEIDGSHGRHPEPGDRDGDGERQARRKLTHVARP
jgi:hypothetical protein